jgi:hypothetical protein
MPKSAPAKATTKSTRAFGRPPTLHKPPASVFKGQFIGPKSMLEGLRLMHSTFVYTVDEPNEWGIGAVSVALSCLQSWPCQHSVAFYDRHAKRIAGCGGTLATPLIASIMHVLGVRPPKSPKRSACWYAETVVDEERARAHLNSK